MALSLNGSGSNTTLNPTTSFDIDIPSGVTDDTILFLAITSRDATGTGPTVPGLTNGAWTKIANDSNNKGTLWYIRAAALDAGSTITITGCVGSAAGAIIAIDGAHLASGTPYTNLTTESNSSGDETHAGITPSYADSWIVLVVHNVDNDNAISSQATANSVPAVITERVDKLSTGGNDCAVMIAAALQSGGPSATGNITWAQTDGATISHVFAIRKAGDTQTTRDITATARIQQQVSRTLAATARIQVSTTRTLAATARVQVSTTRTLNATARVQKTVSQTLAATARVQKTVDATLQATARVQATQLQTIQATARIQATAEQSLQATAAIQNTTDRELQATARVQRTVDAELQATARVQVSVDRELSAVARVQKTATQDITATASIIQTTQSLQHITATARIQATATQDIQATGRVQRTVEQLLGAVARVQRVVEQTIQAVANIVGRSTRDIEATARIQNTAQQTIEATARVQVSAEQTIEATARIIKEGTLQHIQATARIQGTTERHITARVWILEPGFTPSERVVEEFETNRTAEEKEQNRQVVEFEVDRTAEEKEIDRTIVEYEPSGPVFPASATRASGATHVSAAGTLVIFNRRLLATPLWIDILLCQNAAGEDVGYTLSSMTDAWFLITPDEDADIVWESIPPDDGSLTRAAGATPITVGGPAVLYGRTLTEVPIGVSVARCDNALGQPTGVAITAVSATAFTPAPDESATLVWETKPPDDGVSTVRAAGVTTVLASGTTVNFGRDLAAIPIGVRVIKMTNAAGEEVGVVISARTVNSFHALPDQDGELVWETLQLHV